jgi:hypothetical protein
MTMRMLLPKSAKTFGNVVLLIVTSSLLRAQTTLQTPPPYQLTEVKVVPFSQTTNSFLPEIKNDFSGWNSLNISLFVTIEVAGKRGSYNSKRHVEIVANEGHRVIVKRLGDIGVLDESTGKYYVPVWLYGPFCQPVTIKARLVGQARSPVLQRKVDFQCGE